MARRRPVQNGGAKRTGLRDNRDAAALRHLLGKRGIHIMMRIDQPQAVGPEERNAARFAERRDFAFQRRTAFADLLESGCDRDDCLRAGLD